MIENASFAHSRQEIIREMLKTEGRVFCTPLSESLQVSEHTIRRDLQDLAQEGICRRVHGGAISLLNHSGDFATRADDENTVKDKLGAKTARLLRSGAIVFIDAGTTNLAVSRMIPMGLDITIVTNTPAIAIEAMKSSSVEVIMIGGKLNPNNGGALGITASKQIEGMHFDQCILGACAFDIETGVTVFEYEDAEFKKAVVAQSDQVIVALTSDKTPGIARYQVAESSDISDLVVESSIPADKTDAFKEKGISVHFADVL